MADLPALGDTETPAVLQNTIQLIRLLQAQLRAFVLDENSHPVLAYNAQVAVIALEIALDAMQSRELVHLPGIGHEGLRPLQPPYTRQRRGPY